uniref:Glycolipid transfer protein domain-containing protein n=1 Tax=Helicotheca tamesis TaxID=374047 RepID=A0A7S2MRW6_9STRA|mmetsp:Transcript_2400/g.3335  ORF Transcript_2400/g.3335 Transcript_2400/m.3335 type:complete len:922 (+) Transcript_2400:564-3329(+)|eukprot:CAMPEP_0185726714 /NCGR_PEP_ID=MMETSP1171-20130828/2598_1 /TAXON_ID=374046 /ORGANISM="Helicotheca tamensis, Strain CCMP826" /LENGTH=921 /DNA_ID=CAMNT_0028395109 /DNA_START=518 /DNA_END=3283 /DNA_ORIENTATION=-
MRRARSQDFGGGSGVKSSIDSTNAKTFHSNSVGSKEADPKPKPNAFPSSSIPSKSFPMSVASRYSRSQPSMIKRRLSRRSQLNSLLRLDDLSQLTEAEEVDEGPTCKTYAVCLQHNPVALPGSEVGNGPESDGDSSDLRRNNSSENRESPRGGVIMWAMGFGGNPRLAVANLSVLLMVLLTATNLALDVVHAQMHRLNFPYDYDALSTEVIVPPFRYTSPVSDASRRPRPGLGSAAIGSLTSIFCPILPFTGGVDLRRAEGLDEWRDVFFSVIDSLHAPWTPRTAPPSAPSTASLVSGIHRSGAQLSNVEMSVDGNAIHASDARRTMEARRPILSESSSFISRKKIAELTLGDISTAFIYVTQASREEIDNNVFRNSLSAKAKEMTIAIEEATAISMGHGVSSAQTKASQTYQQGEKIGPPVYGDIDALQFCAAMRIFAEWRLLRQVPDGYKGYAVGMSLGHKDIVQNVAKIENAVHAFIDWRLDQKQTLGAELPIISSPTLRELLQYEIDTGINPETKLPRLREKSAAMGLLWVRRQFHYQTSIFSNVLDVPEKYNTARDAVSAAYSEVYDAFHGWAVQKIFNYSFQAAPDADIIFRFMNPAYLKQVTNAAIRGDTEFEDVDASQGLLPGKVGQNNMNNTGDFGEASAKCSFIVTAKDESDIVPTEKNAEFPTNVSGTMSENKEVAVSNGSTSIMLPPEKENKDASVFPTSDLNVSACTKVHKCHQKNETNNGATKTKLTKNDSNPISKLGAHIAGEWDKWGKQLGNERDKWGKHLVGEWDKLGKHLSGEVGRFGDDIDKLCTEFDRFGKQIVGEWDKLTSNVVRLFNKAPPLRHPECSICDVRGGANKADSDKLEPDQVGGKTKVKRSLAGDELEQYVTQQMIMDARRHIVKYLGVAKPLLKDLEGLFDEMNMNDPTKV